MAMSLEKRPYTQSKSMRRALGQDRRVLKELTKPIGKVDSRRALTLPSVGRELRMWSDARNRPEIHAYVTPGKASVAQVFRGESQRYSPTVGRHLTVGAITDRPCECVRLYNRGARPATVPASNVRPRAR